MGRAEPQSPSALPPRPTGRRVPARLLVLVALSALFAASCRYVHPPFSPRLDEPVVLTGAAVPTLIGTDPTRVVAYRYQDPGPGWVQIPVQVDERVMVGFGTAPGANSSPGTDGTVYGSGAPGVTALQYADAATFVGADTDPLLDADDEIVFIARNVGATAPSNAPDPADAVPGTGRRIALSDGQGNSGDVYLFAGQPGVNPSAGRDEVQYRFALTSGDYKSTYKRADGPNPETSSVITAAYRLAMVDRWKTVEMHNNLGNGVDILDGLKARFSFSTCGRSNQTFADAEGAFVANIDGPVRAIRSYVGANSGPLTQETMYFYSDRVESKVNLRVHAIPGIMAFLDFSSAASGMTYGSSTGGPVTIDGNPDPLPTTAPEWQYVSGPQGTLTWRSDVTTTATGLSTSFEWRDVGPDPAECWGDGAFYGVGSTLLSGGIPNTDPRTVPFEDFTSRTIMRFWSQSADPPSVASDWAGRAAQPLGASNSPR